MYVSATSPSDVGKVAIAVEYDVLDVEEALKLVWRRAYSQLYSVFIIYARNL